MKLSFPEKRLGASVARYGLHLMLLCLLLMAGSFRALAQEGTIVGTVTDPSGAAVPNVAVILTNTDTGQSTRLTTNDVGQFVAADLHIGHYDVQAKGANFKLAEQKNVVLTVGDRHRVDFQLQLGNTQESITVEASAVQVQSDTGEISDMINGQQVTQLAANGRSVAELEALVPGASSAQGDFQVPTSAGGDFNVSFNGQRVVHNLWLVDGGEAADRGGGGGADVLPSMDAIAEFRTLTSNYSAEYGLSSAGTMSMVIKSGTRKLQAEAFYYGRNDALDARNYFNPAPQKVAALRFNDWGFNVGGPVEFKHSDNPKTFFFYNMEWRRYIKGGLFNVNTPLASIYPDANGAGTGVVLPATGANGKPIDVVAPSNIAALAAAGGCAPGSTPAAGSPFSQNTIPDCLVSANASALLGAGIFPQPTSGWAFIGGANQPTTGKEEIVRVDHQFTDKFSVFGHFIADQAVQTYGTTQWSGDNVPSVGDTFNNPSYSYVIHATHVIRPNLLNEISFNYDGNRIHILPLGIFQAPSGFTFNRIFTGTNVQNRIPDVNLAQATGSNYTVNWTPWNNTADDYQVRDDVSWTKGSHQFKFGGGWAIYKKVQDYFAETQGGFKFDGSATSPGASCDSQTTNCGFDYADFILGDAQHYAENAYKGVGYWNAISPDAYFQDNWRATHRLTLNLGLRWDGIPHTYEANGNQTNFYPNLYNPANAPLWVPGTNNGQIDAASPGLGPSPIASLQGYSFYLNGMGYSGKNGVPKGLANSQWLNFGPRFGFAYDLFGTGKTVVRGGYGLMYERIQGNDMYNGATNPPFGYSLGASNVLLSDPHNTWSGGTITVPIVPSGVVGINKAYPAPRVSQYSAGVQQQIGGNAVLSISYVGSVDRHQSYWQEINLPDQGQLVSLQNTSFGTDGVTAFNGLVPYQGYTSIKQAFNGGNSHYNSLQTELRGRVTRDLQLQVAYTLARSIDPTTGNGGNGFDLNYVTNPYVGWKYDIGPSVFDRTNVAFVNFIYDIPLARNSSSRFMKSVVGGWQLSGIVTMESGTPLNLAVNSGTVSSVFPGGDVANRPNLVGSISYPKTPVVGNGAVTGIQWVNPAAFQTPAPGTWGNLGFDALRGAGRDDWNLSLFKSFLISESRGSRFEFRADAFNAWNHTQFGGSGQNGGFSNNLTAGNFGQYTSAFDPREFQLGAKLIF
ncbi:MAG TPA: carboxypeptidase-like regulatory domain-containing protein [Terriglobales bacterium]|nr:carboxypeptidase-like regulatory domain-containing protein [Terriglobales bacterium]